LAQGAAAAQAPPANRAPTSGTLTQIIPGHYVYTQNNAGRLFNSGVVAAGDGVLVFDALDSEALARSEREAIAGIIKQPIRYLVSSVFHSTMFLSTLAMSERKTSWNAWSVINASVETVAGTA
jgi:hypothetical protein